jgi:hypothetical protein
VPLPQALAKRRRNSDDSCGQGHQPAGHQPAMMERPVHLPDFDAPPLIEVALSLQFQPIMRFGFVDLGPLSDQFRPHFERIEYHPPLAPMFETFGLRQGMAQLHINLGTGLTLRAKVFEVDDC